MNTWKDPITLTTHNCGDNNRYQFKFFDVDEDQILVARVSADKMKPIPVETFMLKPKQAETLYGWLSSFTGGGQ